MHYMFFQIDASVKEAKERLEAAIIHVKYEFQEWKLL